MTTNSSRIRIFVTTGWSVKVYEAATSDNNGKSWRCITGSMWDLNIDYYTNGNTGQIINDTISSVQVYGPNNNNCTSITPAFNKTSPANSATSQSTSPTLGWGSSTGATSYEYCYDTTNDNACSNWTSNGTSTSKALSGLTASTIYYWHARAINGSVVTYSNGSSTAFWSFTTQSTQPITDILINGGFEDGSANPNAWNKDAWTISYSTFNWATDFVHSGSKSAKISNDTANDARWIQTVNVLPNTNYRLSGWIKTSNIAHSSEVNDIGANLSILDGIPKYTSPLITLHI